MTDEELDSMFPPSGYRKLDPPASYAPIRTPQRKLLNSYPLSLPNSTLL